MGTVQLYVPDSYLQERQPATAIEKAEADSGPGAIRSLMLPSWPGSSPFGSTGMLGPGIGSPHVRREELLGLWRRHTWVRAAIRRIAMIGISEGWEILAPTDDDPGSDDDYDLLARLFAPEVDEVENIRQWQLPKMKLYVTFARLRLFGEASWEVVLDGFGQPIDFALMYGTVVPNVDSRGRFRDPQRAYTQVVGAAREVFAEDEVLRFEVLDIDGRLGVSDLEALELAATTDMLAAVWNRNTFKNNRTPPGVYLFDPNITSEDAAEARAGIEEAYSGVEGANKPYIALKGMTEYKPVGAPFGRDQEFLKGRRFNRDEELALLGTPAGVLGAVEDVSRHTLENLIEIVYRQEVAPLQEMVEQSLNLWIRRQGITGWEFRFRKPTFGDEASEVKAADTRIKIGMSTANQERARRGEPPYPGGNRYWMSPNMVAIGQDPDDEIGAEPAEEGTGGEEETEARVVQRLDELRRWKRVALRMAKGELPPRPFRSIVLSDDFRAHIAARLKELGPDPAGVRAYFDGLMERLKADAEPSSELDAAPAWMRERIEERVVEDARFARESADLRLRRLAEAEVAGL